MKSIQRITRISIVGPESTGKSTLSEQLASYFNTIWVPEFARSYIDKLKRPYHEQDLLKIAKGQLNLEALYTKKANQMIMCDTDLLVIKIWSMHKFGRVHPWIASKCDEVSYDLHLLTKPDLAWEDDPQRENPGQGDYFFELFKGELLSKKAPFKIIKGSYNERLSSAIDVIKNSITV